MDEDRVFEHTGETPPVLKEEYDVKEEQEVKDALQEINPSTSTADEVVLPVSIEVPPSDIKIINECGVCGVVSTPLLKEDGKIGSGGEFEMSTLSPHGRVYKHSIEDEDTFWICCDGCRSWFHGRCVSVEEYQDGLIDKFYCPACSINHGPTIYKRCVAPQRIQFDDPSQIDLPTEIGTKAWIEMFANSESEIPEPDANHVTIFDDGFKFMDSFNRNDDWKNVFLIKNSSGLELRMPASDFCTEDLLRVFGAHYRVDTIDVYRQATLSMTLGSFHNRFISTDRERLYNFLSLEFSKNEKMKELVAPPLLVYELSFVHKFWPDKSDPINYDAEMDFLPKSACVIKEIEVAEEHKKSRPDVALFCLCGMGGSYTDFHIDFGGSSVWYHIFKGKKIFYIAAPTEANLRIYEEYQTMDRRSEIFLGDLFPKGELRRVVINQGETLMIPSGWIHAVYTPEDSLVFGGNFLHHQNIPMQLRVYDIEMNTRSVIGTDDKFLFPQFELVHWYAARSILLANIKEDNDQGKQVSSTIFEATRVILPYLKKWLDRDETTIDKLQSNIEIYKKLKREFENQSKMRDDDIELSGKKDSKKKASKKRRSAGDSDNDDDYSPMKSVKLKIPRSRIKKPKSPDSSPHPSGSTEFIEGKRSVLDDSDTEDSVALVRLTMKGDKYSSALLERPSPMIGEVNVAHMFARRSSSGRAPKIASWLIASAGDEILKEAKKMEESGEMPKERQPVVYSKKMDELMALEDKEDKLYEERKKKPVTNPAAAVKSALPPPKKKAMSTKQRLASKLGLRK